MISALVVLLNNFIKQVKKNFFFINTGRINLYHHQHFLTLNQCPTKNHKKAYRAGRKK